jgi:hypothetical protein
MNIRVSRSQIVLQILLCLPLTGTGLADDFIEEKIEKSFKAVPGGRLTLDAALGSIEVVTAKENVVGVKIQKRAKTRNKSTASEIFKDFVVAFEQVDVDNELKITAKYKRGQEYWNKRDNRLSVRFVIVVPQQYNVNLKPLEAASLSLT